MKKVLITGSTGMIGKLVLQNCIGSNQIKHVVSISRRPTGINHAKITEVMQADFSDFTSVEKYFDSIDIAYYCIGVYTGQVPRDEFRTITVDYTKAFADMLKKHSPEATICFLSGQGADTTGKSRMMFAKDKGAAENYLTYKDFPHTYIFRPAYIYPVIPRKEPNMSYRIIRSLYPLFKRLYPNGVITSNELARAIFTIGLYGGEKPIFENKDIKRISSVISKSDPTS